jgi:hypothetical protein
MGFQAVARALVAFACCAVVSGAHAKNISIDFGDGNFAQSGNNFTLANTTELDRTGDAAGTAVDIGFGVNFGTGTTFSSLFVSENGVVSFGSGLGAFTGAASLGALGAPVIATYYADLVSRAPFGDPLALTKGTITASQGVADPFADGSGAYSTAETVKAFRLTWLGGSLASDPSTAIYTQLLLYSVGASGDFDLRLAYGFFNDTPIAANGALAGFVLGSNTASIGGPFLPTTDYVFSFRNGVLVAGGTDGGGTPVPEPETAGLMLLGVAAAAAMRRRVR